LIWLLILHSAPLGRVPTGAAGISTEAMIQAGIDGRFVGRKVVMDGLTKPTVQAE